MFTISTFLIIFVPLMMAWVCAEVSAEYRRDTRPNKMGYLLAQSLVVLSSAAVLFAAAVTLYHTYV